MTASDWRKALKQFKKKPAIRNKYIKHNKPKERTTGIANAGTVLGKSQKKSDLKNIVKENKWQNNKHWMREKRNY